MTLSVANGVFRLMKKKTAAQAPLGCRSTLERRSSAARGNFDNFSHVECPHDEAMQ